MLLGTNTDFFSEVWCNVIFLSEDWYIIQSNKNEIENIQGTIYTAQSCNALIFDLSSTTSWWTQAPSLPKTNDSISLTKVIIVNVLLGSKLFLNACSILYNTTMNKDHIKTNFINFFSHLRSLSLTLLWALMDLHDHWNTKMAIQHKIPEFELRCSWTPYKRFFVTSTMQWQHLHT